jgi:capsular exopolysaccharide synthesis family protein
MNRLFFNVKSIQRDREKIRVAKSTDNQQIHKKRLRTIKKYYIDAPGTAEIERLGAKLTAMRDGNDRQVVLITSSITGEGKSTIASLLSRCMAFHQNKTLLIDFDIRRPRLDTIFNVSRKNGIIDILQRDLPVGIFIKDTVIPNLVLLTSGILKVSPAEIFNLEKIDRFFKSIRELFDNIILDTPPIVPVSDPVLLSNFADNVLLVVKAGSTPKYTVKQAINMLNDVKVEISGIVLNNMSNVLSHYYDYNAYGYNYYNTSR